MMVMIWTLWQGLLNMGKRRNKRQKRQEILDAMTFETGQNSAATSTGVGKQETAHVHHGGYVCHHGPKEVMYIGNVRVWAGSYREVRGDFDWDIILRLSDGDFDLSAATSMFNEKAATIFPASLNVQKYDPAIIDMRWPDFSEPYGITKEWWKRFNENLKTLPPSIMLIHCFGGHGRTGTALSILAALNGYHLKHPSKDPVQFVRDHYCDNSVESEQQLRYIEAVTGVQIASQAHRWHGFGFMQQGKYDGILPSTTTSGYVHQLSNNTAYGSEQTAGVSAGDAFTLYKKDLKGHIEARWEDDGEHYIFADDKVYMEHPGDSEMLLEVDWTSGSYGGISEHRKSTGGM